MENVVKKRSKLEMELERAKKRNYSSREEGGEEESNL